MKRVLPFVLFAFILLPGCASIKDWRYERGLNKLEKRLDKVAVNIDLHLEDSVAHRKELESIIKKLIHLEHIKK